MIEFPGYQILEQLHESERTVIYRAVADRDQAHAVLKVLRSPVPLPQDVAQFKREYAIAARFDHPGIVRPLSLSRFDSYWVMSLSDLHGQSLNRVLAGRRPVDGHTAIELESFFGIALTLCDALEVIHAGNVVHNDINPSNLIWNTHRQRLQIIDFGIASELSRESPVVQSPHVLEGALHYMSPERTGRMNRMVDFRSDFYSVGATLYELLSGRPPFEASDAMELIHCHMARPPDFSLPGFRSLPGHMIAVMQRLLAKNAEDRYQTIHGLRKDLKLCQSLVFSPASTSGDTFGLSDAKGIFHIPQKLYGREKEIEALLAAFERVSDGSCEMLLVAGYSGIGKSTVVSEIHKPIVQRRGYFVSGKFDQYKRNIPYSSLIQAFQDVIRQILTEPRDRVIRWADKLRAALGTNAGVIANLIPDLRLILGAMEPVPDLPPLDSQNRLNRLFQRFVQAFAAVDHPLVVFLDDLQWADPSSLQLIELFMNDRDERYVLFLGAYRDNEVDEDHPLITLRENLQKRGVPLHTLTLTPLQEEHVTALLADTFMAPAEACLPLARLCCQKTSGNPFFLNQFLRAVHEAGLITYDYDRERWRWDVDAIANASFTDNVTDLMISKIGRLPESTQKLLQLAASVGNRFDLGTLMMVSEQSAHQTQQQLWPAMEADLIRPVDNRYKYLPDNESSFRIDYRFLHDRVQQAAYALATDEEKKRHHLTIGRLLLGGCPDIEEHLFTIVEQLDAGRELVTNPDERVQLARLNHRAGLKARTSAAYHAAARHMRIGISVLPDNPWQSCFELTLALHIGAAEAAYLSGDFAGAEAIYPTIIAHCETTLDTIRCYTVQVSQYQLQGRFREAIEIQRKGLRLLGVDIPEAEAALEQMVGQGFADIDHLCAGRTMQDIMASADMAGSERLAAMQLLLGMWYASYLAGLPTLNAVTTIVMTRLSLTQGNSDIAAFAYVNYAFILAFLLQKYDLGYAFGAMAVELSNLRTNLSIRGSTHFLFATFTNHWNKPLSTSDKYYDDAHAWSLESGDFATVGYVIAVRSTDRVIQGKYLPELLDACERDIALLRKTGQVDMVDCTRVGTVQSIKNLMGTTRRFDTYDDDEFSEERFLTDYADKPLHLAYFYHGKIRNAYLFDTPEAEALAEQLWVVEQYVPGQCKIPEATFYAALIWIRALRRSSRRSDAQAVASRFSALQKRLDAWAAHCPDNFGAKSLLVQAQAAQYRGDTSLAINLYWQAMAVARKTGYLNVEALANELYGDFWLEQGQDRTAELFLKDALHLYRTWGAHGKVTHLQQRHSAVHWFVERQYAGHDSHASMSTTGGGRKASPSDSLDMASILDANRALSSEIGLGGVLTQLIKILRENSGAQTVRLLLLNGNQWYLEGDASGDEADVLQSKLVTLDAPESDLFPLSLLRYVARTGEEIVEEQIHTSIGFGTDPYVPAKQPKSVMCLPIKRFSQVTGIIYLENNLAAGAFTRERARFVRVLAIQAIISIDNARLYESLEEHSRTLQHKVEERTRELLAKNEELRATQRQLVAQEKLASLGVLTAGIAHELKNPLNFVSNFAELSVSLSDELLECLSQQMDRITGDARVEVNEIVETLRGNARKIHEHGRRASQVIDGMLLHARDSRGTRERTDINALLMDAVNLAYHSLRSKAPSFDLHVESNYDESLDPVCVMAPDISRVFINVINNACYALQQKKVALGNAFTPRLSLRTVDRGEHVEIHVRDNGTGIPQSIINQVWNPFFTTKPAGSGAGLGLSISHDIIVGAHRGKMRVESVEGDFTEFILSLPKQAA